MNWSSSGVDEVGVLCHFILHEEISVIACSEWFNAMYCHIHHSDFISSSEDGTVRKEE